MDSNHDKGLQRALCYHYTIGQTGEKLAAAPGPHKPRNAAAKPARGCHIALAGQNGG